jgi:hypothetical protein
MAFLITATCFWQSSNALVRFGGVEKEVAKETAYYGWRSFETGMPWKTGTRFQPPGADGSSCRHRNCVIGMRRETSAAGYFVALRHLDCLYH